MQTSDLAAMQLALEKAVLAGDVAAEGALYIAIGARWLSTRDHERAREHFTHALSLAVRTSNRDLQGQAIHGLAGAAVIAGDPDRAIAHFEQALTIVRELGDRSGEARILAVLDVVRARRVNRAERATEHRDQPLATAANETAQLPTSHSDASAQWLAAYLHKERMRPSGHRFCSPAPRMALRCLRCPVDYFISYRHADAAAYCERLCQSLKDRRLRVLFAPELGIRPQGEHEPEDAYRIHVEGILRPHIGRAKIFVMVGGGIYLGSAWTKWETGIFEEGVDGAGREGKMLSIVGPDTDFKDKIMFHMKAATDGIPIREGLDAWAQQTPSRFVVEALDFHIRRFRRELLAQLFVWLIPSYVRKRIFKMPVTMPFA